MFLLRSTCLERFGSRIKRRMYHTQYCARYKQVIHPFMATDTEHTPPVHKGMHLDIPSKTWSRVLIASSNTSGRRNFQVKHHNSNQRPHQTNGKETQALFDNC